MPQELTWHKAIDKVLASSATPLHYKEITDRIIAQGLRTSIGATPAATVNDLAAVEYIQRVDPEIEKKRIKASLDAALNKL